MNDLDLLELILKAIKQHHLTAYEISKNTALSTVAIQKIINGETKKPNRTTLLKIYDFLEKGLLGTDLPIAGEPKEPFSIKGNPIKNVIPASDIFTNVGIELITLYRKQIDLYEENAGLYRKTTNFLEEKVSKLDQQS